MNKPDLYDAHIVALVINFSEQITDSYEPSDELFDRLLEKALAKVGIECLKLEKLNRSIDYYVTESDIDIYSLPEYERELPPL